MHKSAIASEIATGLCSFSFILKKSLQLACVYLVTSLPLDCVYFCLEKVLTTGLCLFLSRKSPYNSFAFIFISKKSLQLVCVYLYLEKVLATRLRFFFFFFLISKKSLQLVCVYFYLKKVPTTGLCLFFISKKILTARLCLFLSRKKKIPSFTNNATRVTSITQSKRTA